MLIYVHKHNFFPRTLAHCTLYIVNSVYMAYSYEFIEQAKYCSSTETDRFEKPKRTFNLRLP